MALDRQPVCFTCSQPIAEPPAINRLENGDFCPTCRDRLLDSLPSLLPSRPGVESEEAPVDEPYPYESTDDGYDPPTGA
jgi:hypothetical protein